MRVTIKCGQLRRSLPSMIPWVLVIRSCQGWGDRWCPSDHSLLHNGGECPLQFYFLGFFCKYQASIKSQCLWITYLVFPLFQWCSDRIGKIRDPDRRSDFCGSGSDLDPNLTPLDRIGSDRIGDFLVKRSDPRMHIERPASLCLRLSVLPYLIWI